MIYLVEDDESIRELVIYTLEAAGFDIKGFDSSECFWSAMDCELPQLILLDIMLPGEDGLHILKKLRRRKDTEATPIMMITAKSTEFDKVTGLDLGADDYLPKPFGMMELLARVKALLRRSKGSHDENGIYTVGGVHVDKGRHTVMIDGKAAPLTLKEYEVLCMLIENKGIVFSRDQILTKIWGYSFDGENRTVDVHIRSLRQKLKGWGILIETVRGVGYRLEERDEE